MLAQGHFPIAGIGWSEMSAALYDAIGLVQSERESIQKEGGGVGDGEGGKAT